MKVKTKPFPIVEKVLAYVVRQHENGWQILIFSHRDFPEAGLQVPGGTVDKAESVEKAVVREVWEESGLKTFQSIFFLGKDEFPHPEKPEIHERHFFALLFEGKSPDKFTHQVSAGIEDSGLFFKFSWYDLEKVPALAAEQGAYLPSLKARLSTLE